jgi:hypothetical protein
MNSSPFLNGSSANGSNGHSTQWLDGFRLRPRPATKSEAASFPSGSPATGYTPDGTHNHGKPTDGQSQWGVKGQIPSVAFGMPDAEIAEFKRFGRAAAILGQSLESVCANGLQRFEARWAQCRLRFEACIRPAELNLHRLQARIAVRETEANALSLTVPDLVRTVALPRDWRLIPLILMSLLWLAIIPADWYLIASKQFDGAGEAFGPLFATVSWLAVPFLLKWALLSRSGCVAELLLSIFKSTAVALLLLFIWVYAIYGSGGSSGDQQAASLSATMRGAAAAGAAAASIGVHWSVFALQILLCLCTSTALTVQIRELMVGRTAEIANPNRQRLEGEVALGAFCIASEEAAIAPQRGSLVEYQACCARFVAYGEQAWHAARIEQELIDRERQLIEQHRRLLEG